MAEKQGECDGAKEGGMKAIQEKAQTHCSLCGEQLTPEEIAVPVLDHYGNIMCFSCELEHDYEECDMCRT